MADRDSTNREVAEKPVEEGGSGALDGGEAELYRQFLHVASHDLQEPLRKISTFADLLEKGLAEGRPDDVAYALDVIRRSSRRARQLVQDLLVYARATSRPVELTEVRVREVIADVLSTVAGSVLETRAVLTVEAADLTLRADRLQLFQLLLNLVSNALKYRRPNTEPNVTLVARRDPEGVQLVVSDNGIGFDPALAPLLFEPFRRLAGGRDAGSGLGLAICRSIAERHGWSLAAEGRPGVGAVFTVTAPA